LCSHSAWEDLRGNQEGDCAPSGCIDEVEEEEHEYGGRSDASCFGRIVAGSFVKRGSLMKGVSCVLGAALRKKIYSQSD
jgi:hypothetical protein